MLMTCSPTAPTGVLGAAKPWVESTAISVACRPGPARIHKAADNALLGLRGEAPANQKANETTSLSERSSTNTSIDSERFLM